MCSLHTDPRTRHLHSSTLMFRVHASKSATAFAWFRLFRLIFSAFQRGPPAAGSSIMWTICVDNGVSAGPIGVNPCPGAGTPVADGACAPAVDTPGTFPDIHREAPASCGPASAISLHLSLFPGERSADVTTNVELSPDSVGRPSDIQGRSFSDPSSSTAQALNRSKTLPTGARPLASRVGRVARVRRNWFRRLDACFAATRRLRDAQIDVGPLTRYTARGRTERGEV